MNASFYICYDYAYVIVNTENGRRMVYHKQKRGSPSINLAVAERSLNQQENDR